MAVVSCMHEVFSVNESGKGRPPLYSVILSALDVREAYSPAMVSDFAAAHGFLGALHPEPSLDMAFKKNRTRIALGRHTTLKQFPQDGDTQIHFKGRWFSAWYGWRWSGTASLEEALELGEQFFRPLWQKLEAERCYDLVSLFELCRGLSLSPPPKVFETRQGGARLWLELSHKCMGIRLIRRALYAGLDTGLSYPLDRWQAQPTHPIRSLFELPLIGHRLEKERIYTVGALLELACHYGLFANLDPVEQIALRSSLYRFARVQRFPEFGDQGSETGQTLPVPGWLGKRWRNAIFGDDFLPLLQSR